MTKVPSKVDKLRAIIRNKPKAIVAFSGGVDSTLLLRIARDILGPRNVIAVTGVSQTYTADEKRTAQRFARELGVEHVLIETDELASSDFSANPADRCYFCKRELLGKILDLARSRGVDAVCDATNIDDLSDYRPGRKALEESGVTSPLLEAGFTKKDVRILSRRLGLPSWDKPANPCLASRVPYGTPITEETLDRIRDGEAFIRKLGFPIVRLRHHGDLARIEVPAGDLARIVKPATAKKIAARLRSLGYLWTALDVEGYRMGSLNRAVEGRPPAAAKRR
ncbi:MAG: TIGR00268 family protein [Candidatus Aminicenantes bacterium RBG_16_66_30]|nr:MAG: TIGR00268 family protein [Candidatus Aminicenantes bacterium RBG_16_66_30]